MTHHANPTQGIADEASNNELSPTWIKLSMAPRQRWRQATHHEAIPATDKQRTRHSPVPIPSFCASLVGNTHPDRTRSDAGKADRASRDGNDSEWLLLKDQHLTGHAGASQTAAGLRPSAPHRQPRCIATIHIALAPLHRSWRSDSSFAAYILYYYTARSLHPHQIFALPCFLKLSWWPSRSPGLIPRRPITSPQHGAYRAPHRTPPRGMAVSRGGA